MSPFLRCIYPIEIVEHKPQKLQIKLTKFWFFLLTYFDLVFLSNSFNNFYDEFYSDFFNCFHCLVSTFINKITRNNTIPLNKSKWRYSTSPFIQQKIFKNPIVQQQSTVFQFIYRHTIHNYQQCVKKLSTWLWTKKANARSYIVHRIGDYNTHRDGALDRECLAIASVLLYTVIIIENLHTINSNIFIISARVVGWLVHFSCGKIHTWKIICFSKLSCWLWRRHRLL